MLWDEKLNHFNINYQSGHPFVPVLPVTNHINDVMSIGQAPQNGDTNIINMYCIMNTIIHKFSESKHIKLTVKYGRNVEEYNYMIFNTSINIRVRLLHAFEYNKIIHIYCNCYFDWNSLANWNCLCTLQTNFGV